MNSTEVQLSSYVDKDYLHYRFDTTASHTWSLDNGPCPCGSCQFYLWYQNNEPTCCSVNNCGYDLSGDILTSIYGTDLKPRTKQNDFHYWFDQWNYINNTEHSDPNRLMKWGIMYIPDACLNDTSQCLLHINYHGCDNRHWPDRESWAIITNLNEYAESNNIIVVYP